MNTRNGQIYQIENPEERAELESRLGHLLTDLTDHENEVLQSLPIGDRAEQLALMRFIAERRRLKAPHGVEVQNAFRLGYRAGVKNNI